MQYSFISQVSFLIKILCEQISEYVHLFTDILKTQDDRGFFAH